LPARGRTWHAGGTPALPSHDAPFAKSQIRWRNTAQWARNTMANDDGRMKKGSRNGYWEISDKGRAWLKSH